MALGIVLRALTVATGIVTSIWINTWDGFGPATADNGGDPLAMGIGTFVIIGLWHLVYTNGF